MKHSIKYLAALAVLGFSGSAFAQASSSDNGAADATIVIPIHITCHSTVADNTNTYLDFGNLVGSGGAGTASETVTPNNANDVDPGISQTNCTVIDDNETFDGVGGGHEGDVDQASYWITGDGAFAFTLTQTVGPLVQSNAIAGLTLNVLNSLGVANNGNAVVGATWGGSMYVGVGGTITFPANNTQHDVVSETITEAVAYN